MNISRNCHPVNSQHINKHKTYSKQHSTKEERWMESLLLIGFSPRFAVFVIISLIIIINPGVKLSFMRKGNLSWSF